MRTGTLIALGFVVALTVFAGTSCKGRSGEPQFSEERYAALYAEIIKVPEADRPILVFEKLAEPDYKIYSDALYKALEAMALPGDQRDTVVFDALREFFLEECEDEAVNMLGEVAPRKRGEALTVNCLDEDEWGRFNRPVLERAHSAEAYVALAMTLQAMDGKFADKKLHLLAYHMLMDPLSLASLPPLPDGEASDALEASRTLWAGAFRDNSAAFRSITVGGAEVAEILEKGEDDYSVLGPTKKVRGITVTTAIYDALKLALDKRREAAEKLSVEPRNDLLVLVDSDTTLEFLLEVVAAGRAAQPEGALLTLAVRLSSDMEEGPFGYNASMPIERPINLSVDTAKTPTAKEETGVEIHISYNGFTVKLLGKKGDFEPEKLIEKTNTGSCDPEYHKDYRVQDYIGLHEYLDKLRNDSALPLAQTVTIQAPDSCPWYVLAPLLDLVDNRRKPGSYTDFCTFIKAPRTSDRLFKQVRLQSSDARN